MIIGLDLDGVVYDYVENLKHFLRYNHGVFLDVLTRPITSYNIAENWGVKERQFAAWQDEFVLSGGFAKGKPMPGAVDLIANSIKEGNQIYLITERGSSGNCRIKASQDTLSWIGDYLPHPSGVVFAKDKHLVECDIYLDDCTDVLKGIRKYRTNALPVCCTRSWNSDWDGTRISSLDEFF